MRKTSTEAKTRWNEAHYTTVKAAVPKGQAEQFKQKLQERGESAASVIKKAIAEYLAE